MRNANTPPLASDNRRSPRQRAFLRAKISYLDGAVSLDCVVNQISGSGARIDVKEEVTLPECFRIAIPLKRLDCTARVVRRDADGAAIAFLDAAEAASTDVSALNERVRMLEAENKMLRATCDALAAQLERYSASY